jgi:hypothetical protein
MFQRTRVFLKERLPRPVFESLRLVANPSDIASAIRFMSGTPAMPLSLRERGRILRRIFTTLIRVTSVIPSALGVIVSGLTETSYNSGRKPQPLKASKNSSIHGSSRAK